MDFAINGDLDINGWDICKVLKLMSVSNVTPFEWLQSPIVYKNQNNFQAELWNLSKDYFCPRTNAHHYLGIARGAMASLNGDEIGIKKLFYVLRPLLAALWCIQRKEIAPMNIFPMMELFPKSIEDKVRKLIEEKAGREERFPIKLDSEIKNWIDCSFEECITKSNAIEKQILDIDNLDVFFRKIIN